MTAIAALMAGVLAGVVPAPANHIPGATYSGTVAGGGTVTVVVSAAGTTLGFTAHDVPATPCTFTSQNWPSIAVLDHAFSAGTASTSNVSGTFPSAQTASGTLRLYSSFPACDSGTKNWMATTPAQPPDDTTPPDTTIDSGPDGPTADATPTFAFHSSESGSTFECRVDSAGFTPCTSSHTTAPLSDGGHTFEVRAIDQAANIDPVPAARQFTVDTTPPDSGITSGPAGLTNDATPTFAFEGGGGATSFECAMDAAAFATCSSPYTGAVFVDGEHTFRVRAIDAVGNVEPIPSSRTFTLDTTPPDTTIVSGPPAFGFASTEPGTFECQLDGWPFQPCAAPYMVPALAPGAHVFSVRAIDAAGNVDASPAVHPFTVAAPVTPTPTPAPTPTPTATPTLSVTLSVGSTRLGAVRRRGLSVTATCTLRCTAAARLKLGAATARRLRLPTTIGRATRTFGPGRRTFAVSLTRRATRRLTTVRKVVATLRVEFTGAGQRSVKTRKVTLRRRVPAPAPTPTPTPGPGANHAPAFPGVINSTAQTSFQYDANGRLSGAVTTITITSPATDPDGDAVSYSWAASNGSIQGNGLSATWNRPITMGEPAPGTATVTASDGHGGTDQHVFEFR